jgi:hypothetical protein
LQKPLHTDSISQSETLHAGFFCVIEETVQEKKIDASPKASAYFYLR